MAESPLIDNCPIPTNTSHYTSEQKLQACALYAVLGNFLRVSERLNIPDNTIHTWKKEDWWDQHLVVIREETKIKTLASIDTIVDRALSATQQRIDEGDAIVHQGEVTGYRPMNGKDVATVAAIMIDKRQILLNMPTSIRGESAGMDALAKQFEELARASRERQVVSDQ